MSTPSDEVSATQVVKPTPAPEPLSYKDILDCVANHRGLSLADMEGTLSHLVTVIAPAKSSGATNTADALLRILILIENANDALRPVIVSQLIEMAYKRTSHFQHSLNVYSDYLLAFKGEGE